MPDSDIVTELRKRHANCTGSDPRITPIVGNTIFQEAADEIERLWAAWNTAMNERNEARAKNVRLLSQLQEYEVREL